MLLTATDDAIDCRAAIEARIGYRLRMHGTDRGSERNQAACLSEKATISKVAKCKMPQKYEVICIAIA